MSSENIHIPVEIHILCLKKELGLKSDTELADMMGTSINSFSNRRKTGTLLKALKKFAAQKNIQIPELNFSLNCVDDEAQRLLEKIVKIKRGDPDMYETLRYRINETYIAFLESKLPG